jgi:ABC-2 type transport system ATP-binding protein
LQAGLYGVPKKKRITDIILKMVALEKQADSYSRSLSGGMKRRLLIAKAMVHQPPILVLDEPTAGVDVELRKNLWENVKALNKEGVTIILTTHYLFEAQEMCDRIASNNTITAIYEKNSFKFDDIANVLREREIEILDITTEDGDLEDVFVQLTNN